jgi:hypothetical protein
MFFQETVRFFGPRLPMDVHEPIGLRFTVLGKQELERSHPALRRARRIQIDAVADWK